MASVIDVMKYVTAHRPVGWGEVQMQKLVYYSQAWSLAWEGRPLFADRIEAWKRGPVVPALRHRDFTGDPFALSGTDAAIVNAVLDHYGHMNGTQLSDLAHAETPWASTWERREHPGDWCNDEISQDLMRRFYSAQAISGKGPKRPAPTVVGEVASDEDVLAIAAANAVHWHDALELLAR